MCSSDLTMLFSRFLLLAVSSAAALRLTGPLPVVHQPQVTTPRVVGVTMETKTGKCKWFNIEKGYGFIEVDGETSDIFVHQSDIYAPGFRSLAEGESLEFKMETDPKSGKVKAVDVTGPDGAYVQGSPKPEYDDEY